MANAITLLNQRTKYLGPDYAYKLSGNTFGQDVPMPREMEYDEGTMSLWIPFADGHRRDGVGDLLEVGGIDTSRHKMNPIVLFDHGKKVDLPIGKAEDCDGNYTVEIDPVDRSAKLNCFFYQNSKMFLENGRTKDLAHGVFCEQLFDMAVKRYIRAGSIGYQVIKAAPLQPDYDTGTPSGMHLYKILMLEGSLVVLPANQDTVAKMLSLPKVCGKPLSPYLVKSLTPYAPTRKAQVVGGYEQKAVKKPTQQQASTSQPMPKPDTRPYPQGWQSGMEYDAPEVHVDEKPKTAHEITHHLHPKIKDIRSRLRNNAKNHSSHIIVLGKDMDEVVKDCQMKGISVYWKGTEDFDGEDTYEKLQLVGGKTSVEALKHRHQFPGAVATKDT